MNARTSRLLRRVALVANRVETVVAQRAGDNRRVPTAAMQLASMKRAWNLTQRPKRGEARVGLVKIFNEMVGGLQ